MYHFYQLFNRNRSQYGIHKISQAGIQQIQDFSQDMIREKSKESAYKVDGGQKGKRMGTGFLGEMALGEYIGRDFVDLTVGNSKSYSVPDLHKLGLNIGVKTVEMGNFHLIPKNPKTPEVIVVKTGDLFYICGVASVETLRNCRDASLIKSSGCKIRDYKTGFYGLDQLVPFGSYEELVRIAVEMNACVKPHFFAS